MLEHFARRWDVPATSTIFMANSIKTIRIAPNVRSS